MAGVLRKKASRAFKPMPPKGSTSMRAPEGDEIRESANRTGRIVRKQMETGFGATMGAVRRRSGRRGEPSLRTLVKEFTEGPALLGRSIRDIFTEKGRRRTGESLSALAHDTRIRKTRNLARKTLKGK